MKSYSPLRYPGGKAALSNFVKALISRNDMMGCEYAEPYCGGAGIAIELLRLEFVTHIHLNDSDPAIHRFWSAVVNETEEFCRRISTCKLDIRTWKRHRAVLANAHEHSTLDVGFAAFYLNRANRSGILSAGPIGGYEQAGEWLMDARFNRSDLIDRIESIARFRDRISVYGDDARIFLKRKAMRSKKTLCYLDPPYVVQGKRLYRNFYDESDHRAICKIASELRCPWIVSYDNVPLIAEIYKEFRQVTYGIGYSANMRSVGSEIMIFSPTIDAPNVRSPLTTTSHEWMTASAA